MSAFLTLDSVSHVAPDGRILFDGLTLALGRERVGVVGRNGSGKSTLLRLIAGEIEPTAGSVQRAGSVGTLAQALDPRLTIAAALGIADDMARLHRLESGEGSADDAAAADWTLEARVAAALAATGLSALPLDSPVARLSGGERARIALARLTIEAPDVLLLDEPTNNLDARGRSAVLRILDGWRGGVVVASHDRTLLERIDRIVALSPAGVSVFGGTWSAFVAARDAARARVEALADRAAKELRRTRQDMQAARERQDRRDKAGRAKRAKGDAPKILADARAERAEQTAARSGGLAARLVEGRTEALQEARARLEVVTPLAIELPRTGVASGRVLLEIREVVIDVSDRHLFGPVSFEVRGPARLAIHGENGSGKTTLLRLVMGEVGPTHGTIRRLTGRIAMLDQHVGMLDPNETILENLRRLNPAVSDNEARAALARFAFRNEAALRVAGTLSGGERMRAGLACTFAAGEPPELLLLDEPTNHLDLASIEELEAALAAYDGALIVVSHDARFLEAIAIERTIAL